MPFGTLLVVRIDPGLMKIIIAGLIIAMVGFLVRSEKRDAKSYSRSLQHDIGMTENDVVKCPDERSASSL
jgi:hypothetical protein